MAATQERNTSQFAGDYYVLPVKAATKIYAGTLVAIDATGHAIPAKAAASLTAAGRAEDTVDNSAGADGDVTAVVARGVFKWDNDAASAVDQADVGQDCYMLDDETVTAAASDGASESPVSYSVAGKVLGIDSDGGVIVETR